MTSNEIRSKYLAFFKERGHVIVPSASLVPENDPTTLFTGSGMQPMLQYFLGTPHPLGKRITDSQKSFRAQDIEEVGDNRHTTFFEMLGNWSFGDYFKQEQIPWMFEFLTKELGLDPRRLYFTCYSGNNALGIPRDEEAASLWKKLLEEKGIDAGVAENAEEKGMQGARIFYYGDKKNWWSRVGVPENMPIGEPGGPDTEMFWDFGAERGLHEASQWRDEPCHVNCDCGRFMEIGNNVFMEYVKTEKGFEKLPKPNVDFGGGLERLAAALKDDPDMFKIDLFESFFDTLREKYGKDYYNVSGEEKRQLRIIADHVRAAVFIAADGVIPSSTERGYFLRRLLRRSIFYGYKFARGFANLYPLTQAFIYEYREAYPELLQKEQEIQQVFHSEEIKFNKTLEKGVTALKKIFNQAFGGVDPDNLPRGMVIRDNVMRVDGKEVFKIYETYGLPLELSQEIMTSWGLRFDEETMRECREALKKHQELSRAGSEQKFKGGLADTAEKTVRLHTAHHLLLRALQIVLGDHVKQRGSNITQERLRIDFTHGEKMTKEQLAEVERVVNEKITEDLPVIRSEMSKDDAERLGAEHEFGQKYPDRVSVYSVGPKDATPENPQFERRFSIEFCGGPHVSHTGELASEGKRFVIMKEEAVSAGVRRIKANLV